MTETASADADSHKAALIRGFNEFGLRLYRGLPADENAFFSPLCIAVALGAVLVGARGQSGREIAAILGVTDLGGALQLELAALLKRLCLRRGATGVLEPESGEWRIGEGDLFRLNVANALFAARDYPLLPAYLETLRDCFSTEAVSIDFGDPGPAVARINGWVENHTEGKVSDLISASQLGVDARLILINAVYFLAAWLDPFEQALTRPQPFHLLPDADTGSVEVDMMRSSTDLPYMADTDVGFEAVEIPYEAMSLLVLLPQPGRFRAVERAVDVDLLERIIEELERLPLDLQLPRFQLESRIELREPLLALGLRDAFDPDRASFSGITEDPDGLVLSEVVHRARVRVDEQGTEAVAATALNFVLGEIEEDPVKPISLAVDRPFLFLIRDPETGTILFLGRVLNPLA